MDDRFGAEDFARPDERGQRACLRRRQMLLRNLQGVGGARDSRRNFSLHDLLTELRCDQKSSRATRVRLRTDLNAYGPTGMSLPTNTGGPEGLPSGDPPGGSTVTA